MRCPMHVHAKMQEQSEAVRVNPNCQNFEETQRLVFRCSAWADYAKTRRCAHMAVIYLPTRSKLCHDCGCILSGEQRQAGRKRCCACEHKFRKKVL